MSNLATLLPLAAALTALAQVSLKKASQYNLFRHGLSGETLLLFAGNTYIWLGLFLYFASFVLSVKIFEMGNLSVITPAFMGMVFVFVSILSFAIFQDALTLKKMCGQAIIIVGVYTLMS